MHSCKPCGWLNTIKNFQNKSVGEGSGEFKPTGGQQRIECDCIANFLVWVHSFECIIYFTKLILHLKITIWGNPVVYSSLCISDFHSLCLSVQELVSSYGHKDSDMPGAERDSPPAGLPDMPLATGMHRRQVRWCRDLTTTATDVPRGHQPTETLKTPTVEAQCVYLIFYSLDLSVVESNSRKNIILFQMTGL